MTTNNKDDFHSTSVYHSVWATVRDAQATKDNPDAKVRVVAPAEMHKRIDKALRKRKWLEQRATGKDYGVLHSSSETYKEADAIVFWLVRPLAAQL